MRDVIAWDLAFEDTADLKDGPERNYKYVFIATLASVYTDPSVIWKYSECPKWGQRHQFDIAAFVVSVVAERMDDTRDWKVTVQYSTNVDDPDKKENPLERPAKIKKVNTFKDKPTVLDGKGRPRVNSAGDLVPTTTNKPIQKISVLKNVAKIPDWFRDLPGSVNKSTVRIQKERYAPRTLLLMQGEQPDIEYQNGKSFYPLSFELEYDAETHDKPEISRGFHELVPETYMGIPLEPIKLIKRRITIGKAGEYPKTPQFLDEEGKHIEIDKKDGKLDLSKIHIIRYSDFPEANLGNLPYK